jgi:hypothetical protein
VLPQPRQRPSRTTARIDRQRHAVTILVYFRRRAPRAKRSQRRKTTSSWRASGRHRQWRSRSADPSRGGNQVALDFTRRLASPRSGAVTQTTRLCFAHSTAGS